MPRSIWTGSVSFGLVNVPIKLVSSVQQKEVRFHMLHDKDGGRIQFKRVCSLDAKEVPYEHIVKGFETSRGRWVTIAREELEALDPKKSRTIDIEDFVDLSEIDPVYYERTYWAVPDRGAGRAYALLLAAMKKAKRVGVARFVMRDRQHLCAVRPVEGVLAVSTMQYADEVVAPPVEDVPDHAGTAREMQVAMQLIEALSTPFEPEKYQDDYRERVLELIKKKQNGEEIVVEEAAERPAPVKDLFAALKESLASPRGEERPKRRAVTRTTKRAARGASGPRRRRQAAA